MRQLFRQFSFPGGIPSHAAPETPGSINEGGELGYSLAHAYGAAFDNPDLLVACVIGDGEAETGPLAASWHSNKFLNPRTDGAVLPILHLNGYKIANPTVLARIPRARARRAAAGYGHEPLFVRGGTTARSRRRCTRGWPRRSTRRWTRSPRSSARPAPAAPRTAALADDRAAHARRAGPARRWSTGCRSRAPCAPTRCRCRRVRENPEHLRQLEEWMRSYRPEELFDERGALVAELAALAPRGRAADERQPPRQRRPAAARAAAAGLPRLRRRGASTRAATQPSRPGCSAPSCAT